MGGKRQNPPRVKLRHSCRTQIRPECPIFGGESSRNTLFFLRSLCVSADPFLAFFAPIWRFEAANPLFTVAERRAPAGGGLEKTPARHSPPAPSATFLGETAHFSRFSPKPPVSASLRGGGGMGGGTDVHAARFGGPTAPQHPRDAETGRNRPKSTVPPPTRVILGGGGRGAPREHAPSPTPPFGVVLPQFGFLPPPPSLPPTLTVLGEKA